MLKVKCPSCGKQVIWDDFQPSEIRCPKCNEKFDVHDSLKKNIDIRINGEAGPRFRCPKCLNFVDKRWFAKCPSCQRYLFGNIALGVKPMVLTALMILYVALSALYFIFLR